MASLYLLIPIAIMLVCVAVAIFIWAVKSDQFEDLDRQGSEILFDEETKASVKDKKMNIDFVAAFFCGLNGSWPLHRYVRWDLCSNFHECVY